jgi:ABC-2 type transport system permease protein
VGKDLFRGPKNFILVWAVIAPVVISLVVSLIFGTLFTEKPRLGIVDEGNSQLVAMAQETASIISREYDSVFEVKEAVANGHVDVGIVLPADFDSSVRQGKKTHITGFVSGESLAKNGTILGVTLFDLIREVAGQEPPVEIESTTLGDEVSIPWNQRLLPLIVLMAVFLGGLFLPATSVINEKEKRTLTALLVTPTTIGDIFIAKGLVGVILSLFAGVVILLLNQAFGVEPLLLVVVLALGSIMAVGLGLLLGAVLKDITTLFAVWKFGGILLFGPAFIYMFPQIPQWISRLFPTYYILQPVIQISQRGGSLADIASNLFILIGLDILIILIVILALRRSRLLASVG